MTPPSQQFQFCYSSTKKTSKPSAQNKQTICTKQTNHLHKTSKPSAQNKQTICTKQANHPHKTSKPSAQNKQTICAKQTNRLRKTQKTVNQLTSIIKHQITRQYLLSSVKTVKSIRATYLVAVLQHPISCSVQSNTTVQQHPTSSSICPLTIFTTVLHSTSIFTENIVLS
jgi:hypothetical protein